MNRIIAAVVLLVIDYTEDMLKIMESDRETTVSECKAEISRSKDIGQVWEKKQGLLAALLPHDELEDIEIGIMNLPDYAEQGLLEEYVKTLNDCINRLHHIKETENPTIKNIF